MLVKFILLIVIILIFSLVYYKDKIGFYLPMSSFLHNILSFFNIYANIFYIILIILLIIGVFFSKYECFNSPISNILSPKCSVLSKLDKLKPIISNFNLNNTTSINKAFDNTNQFTISAIMNTYDFLDTPGWQKLFNAGTADTNLRTPGVWLNQGNLHVRASTDKNWNDGVNCWKIEPTLEKGMNYHLILVYNKNTIDVYLDGQLLQHCTTDGTIVPGLDLFIGGGGANIDLSLAYLPDVLTNEDVTNCWMILKELTISKKINKVI